MIAEVIAPSKRESRLSDGARLRVTSRMTIGCCFISASVLTPRGEEHAYAVGNTANLPRLLDQADTRTAKARAFFEGVSNVALLSQLRTNVAMRGRGYASSIIEGFCAEAHTREAQVCVLHVDPVNVHNLIRFYEKRSFVLLAPETRFHAALMGRRLDAKEIW